ncbi:NAD-dependent epimerase dehydratase, putative [Babesia ovata]|uniref:NAD-dependent epimerase dehydratase, putative n=1 Tax=Babesia ovata TaxID=189622 RepID=A0A2H6KCR6_9APIC|nr:NAD-dependent epimerase dehydratase, putative [Babesia ovata]GBE60796.1 NAD-dependent epimerase dehydratase, putative [Babesia ovata]
MFRSRTFYAVFVSVVALLGTAAVDGAAKTAATFRPNYLCEDHNDPLCLFCRRYAKSSHEPIQFPSTIELKVRLSEHLNKKARAMGDAVLEEVGRRLGTLTAELDKLGGSLSFVSNSIAEEHTSRCVK